MLEYRFNLLVVVILVLGLTVVSSDFASADSTSVIGVSVANPVQYPAKTSSVHGLRLNVLYAHNDNLTGLDLGAGINRLNGDLYGVQVGLYNTVGNSSEGIQVGAVNITQQSFTGVQFGLANATRGSMDGLQVGLVNKSHKLNGFQIGLVNTSFYLNGLQVGLINMKQDSLKSFPQSVPYRIWPIVNWTF